MTSVVRRWLSEEGDTYVLSLVRAIWGGFLLFSAVREAARLFRGPHFADVFHVPLVPEALVPGRALWVALVAAQIVLALLIASGRWARPALLVTALIGMYLLGADRLSYHNNRYALLLVAFLLAFSPCDSAFVVGKPALAANMRRGPLFFARLAQVQMSIIYLASGGSKLLDPDWRGGLVLGDRLVRATSIAVAKGVPATLMAVLSDPSFASALAKLAIGTELVLAVALFVPRTRSFALWWGVMFHLTIEVTSKVELFTWFSLVLYALFAVPALHERAFLYDPARRPDRLVLGMIRRLDWLARFETRADPVAAGHGRFMMVDRDGTRASGLRGATLLARGIPLFFPLFVPLWVLARVLSPRTDDTRHAAC
jgi:hypothetical protein